MEKENDTLSSLFQQARNEKIETSHHEVGRWIGYFSILALLGAWLTKLKVLFTKSYLMYTAIILSTSIGIGSYFFMDKNQENQSVSTLVSTKNMELDTPIVDNPIPFSANQENLQNQPQSNQNPTTLLEENIEQPTQADSDLIQHRDSNDEINEAPKPPKNEYKDVGAFSKLVVSDVVRVVLVQDGSQGVKLAEGTDESLIKITNKSGTLIIERSNTRNNNTELKVYVSIADLSSISAGDASRISTESTMLQFKSIEIQSSDASRIDLNLTAKKVKVLSSDASRISLKGKADEIDLVTSDATRIVAFDFPCMHVKVLSSDASRIQVSASKTLKIKISDATTVEYKGNPESVEKDAKMPSKVVKVD